VVLGHPRGGEGEQTGGAFGLIDNLMPAGFASPYHVHRNEDESFYVVEGEMTFCVGEERVEAEAGAFVYGPRGVPHGFEVEGTAPARILLQNHPALEGATMPDGQKYEDWLESKGRGEDVEPSEGRRGCWENGGYWSWIVLAEVLCTHLSIAVHKKIAKTPGRAYRSASTKVLASGYLQNHVD
jgi:quercetin dioxygenase-like cupin family protein